MLFTGHTRYFAHLPILFASPVLLPAMDSGLG
jgi:hypothetical protein